MNMKKMSAVMIVAAVMQSFVLTGSDGGNV